MCWVLGWMGIGDYVAGARKKVNSFGRRVGNGVYDGLGDALNKDIDLGGAARVGLASVVLGTVAVSGCASVVGGYVGAKVAQNNSKEIQKSDLRIMRWNDDGDGRVQNNELLGDIGDSVNLKGVRLYIDMGDISRMSTPIEYTIMDENGNILASREILRGAWTFPKGCISPGKYRVIAQQKHKRGVGCFREFIVE